MTGLLQDLGYALRLLRRQPSFALFVVLTLAVGIGANTAVFSVVYGVLLNPLPYAQSDRLVRVWGRFDPESGFDFPQFSLSGPEFLDYKQQSRALADAAAFSTGSATIGAAGGDPERVPAASVTPNLFSVLGVRPAMGRAFSEEEARPGGPPLLILSNGYWKSRFGGDAGIIGRTVLVNGTSATVIGVMPESFTFPRDTTKVWGMLRLDPANPGGRSSHSLHAIGRLGDGQTLTTARAELQTLMADWKARFPKIHTGHYLFIRPLLEDVSGNVRPALLLLLACTGFVLMIVCANVACVVLARGEARTREMAIRGALGAERAALVRLSLVESGLLAFAGGAAGLALAYAGVRALLAIDPTSVPRAHELGLNWTMVAAAAGGSTIAAILFGLAPALRGARAELQGTLRDASLTTTGSGRLVFRRALVACEVALTVLLVVAAGLTVRSFSRLVSVDPGFKPDGLLTAAVSLPSRAYAEAARVDTFFDQLLTRLQSAPGVRSVSAGTTLPMWTDQGVWDFDVEGRPKPGTGQPAWNAAAVMVMPGYFETLGIPLVRGRFFAASDDARAMPVVVISESMASRFFAGEDPVGRRIRVAGDGDANSWMTIVGVCGDIRSGGLSEPPPPAYYFVQSQTPRTIQGPFRTLTVLARTAGDPAPAMEAIRTAVRELDPALAVYDVQTADHVIGRSVAQPRFTATLLACLAMVGIVLGASGIYGVLAYTVARRTHEIGIRRALGAQPRQLGLQVVAAGMSPVVAGIAAGLALSFWTVRWWRSELFGVSPADPLVYSLAAAGALLVACAATIIPVRRALRISPVTALRTE